MCGIMRGMKKLWLTCVTWELEAIALMAILMAMLEFAEQQESERERERGKGREVCEARWATADAKSARRSHFGDKFQSNLWTSSGATSDE